jgi:mRNA interferase MazF
MVRRGDIWLVNFDPTVGSEIRKTRPALIVSPPEMNDSLMTVIAAPLTTGSRRSGFRVETHLDGKEGMIVLDHIRSVDKRRLVRKIGTAPPDMLSETLTTLRTIFDE